MAEFAKDFFEKLHTASGFSFPVKCPKCGKHYANAHEFIDQTKAVESLDTVFESHDDEQRRILEIIRLCSCGKAMLEAFFSRRDTSIEGVERRAEFSHFLKVLSDIGLPEGEAREELLNLIHGRKSEILDRLGIDFTDLDVER